MGIIRVDGEQEDSVPGGTRDNLWYSSSDQKFFTVGPDSPLTAIFLGDKVCGGSRGGLESWKLPGSWGKGRKCVYSRQPGGPHGTGVTQPYQIILKALKLSNG